MTARQIIRGRCENALLWLLLVAAVFAVLVILKPGPGYAWIGFVVFFGFVAIGTYVSLVIDCPKCHVAFGQMVWQVSYPSMALMPIKYCPHCALVLDNPWPVKAT